MLFRRSLNQVNTIARRNFSGHVNVEEVKAEAAKWYKLTILMVGVSTAAAVYNYVAHEHTHGRTGLPYMRIRSKPYPWQCSDCTLFDGDCWKECRGEAVPEH